jgi:glutaredoxin
MPPPQSLNLQGLVLFGMPNCVACDQAARWLEDNSFMFRKYDVSTSQATIVWLMQEVGAKNVPQFFFNGHHLQGGFAQVQQLAASGELRKPGVTQL